MSLYLSESHCMHIRMEKCIYRISSIRMARSINFILVLRVGLFEGALGRTLLNSNPQPAVNSFEVSPFFYIASNWACVIALLKLTSQLFTTSPQSLHNFCCTSLLHLTTIFAAPHFKSTAPHYKWTAAHHWTSPQSLLHLTTIFAAPHHRSTLTTNPPSPRSLLHLTTNFTAPTNSNLAYRNPTPALQKLVVISRLINILWGWGLKLRSAEL